MTEQAGERDGSAAARRNRATPAKPNQSNEAAVKKMRCCQILFRM